MFRNEELPLVGDHFLYSHDLNVLFKDNIVGVGRHVVQWLVRWTLGRRARVQVLPGACRCILKQDALPTLLRLSDKT